jgi:hypothetical protein
MGVSPRANERASFEGKASGPRVATIVGWDLSIFSNVRSNQRKVLTNPSTEPGDSGAALVDTVDNIIGFSFFRTGIGEQIEFSAWIWADSVYQAHGLTDVF